ncbi:hypothetical protein TNCV_1747201 [Trichonephila clavipes]|nr:hypothetical protein TNCV_1747201 [Trichonephila clavipes]
MLIRRSWLPTPHWSQGFKDAFRCPYCQEVNTDLITSALTLPQQKIGAKFSQTSCWAAMQFFDTSGIRDRGSTIAT